MGLPTSIIMFDKISFLFGIFLQYCIKIDDLESCKLKIVIFLINFIKYIAQPGSCCIFLFLLHTQQPLITIENGAKYGKIIKAKYPYYMEAIIRISDT